MKAGSVALMIYGDADSGRNALTEEKYKDLANAFTVRGFKVSSVLYNDAVADQLRNELLNFDAILVWVNPIEQGNNRKLLDALLIDLSNRGRFVSSHPDIIMKIGTKAVLFQTKDMDWGGDTKMYTGFEEFKNEFPRSLIHSGTRVLKQFRGNGGDGIFKIIYHAGNNNITLIHAKEGNVERTFSFEDFYKEFESYFLHNDLLIDQEWNQNINNGMVRCYLTGTKVSGFGYQEVNALYDSTKNSSAGYIPPGKRFYYSQNCALFRDLKDLMENKWVPQLQEKLFIQNEMMPVIWDADFFINEVNSVNTIAKYSLCEINVSCVSPFPPSSINFIVEEVSNRI